MRDVMVLVLFEVASSHFPTEVVQNLELDVENVHQIILFENLVDDVRKSLVCQCTLKFKCRK
jgi:hypothetical protein